MNLNIKEIRDMDENPLHFAAITNQIEIGKLFIEKYKVNSTDKQGHTPLMFAIKNHAKEFIQFLLQQPEIDINLQDKIKHLFILMEFKYFFNGVSIFFISYLTPLHYTIIENDIITFKQLFNSDKIEAFLNDNSDTNIWHYAAKYGRIEILNEICSKTHENINDCDINKIKNYILLIKHH